MDKTEKENWAKIKEAMEESGNTDNFFYKRACDICDDKPDPLELK